MYCFCSSKVIPLNCSPSASLIWRIIHTASKDFSFFFIVDSAAPPPKCVPHLALPRRVRFACHLCSYAKRRFRVFSLFPSPLLLLPSSRFLNRNDLRNLFL